MPVPAPVVAVLVSNPALSAILTTALAASPRLRVREFESAPALATYMRLARVDLLVCDFTGDVPADRLVESLRRDPATELPGFQAVGLTGGITAELKERAARAGIDEVVIKPMSPKYLLERVLSRLDRTRSQSVAAGLRRRNEADDLSRFGGNVVPLFDRAPQPAP